MTTTRQRGPMSQVDKEFILANSKNMSAKQIAEKLNRTESMIQKFIKSHESTNSLTPSNAEINDEKTRIEKSLKKSPRYNQLKLKLSKDELSVFVSEWVSMISEFGGLQSVQSSELSELEDLLVNRALVSRALILQKGIQDRLIVLRLERDQIEAIPMDNRTPEQQMEYVNALGQIEVELTQENRAIKQVKDTTDTINKISSRLMKARASKEDQAMKAGVDFTALLKKTIDFQDRQIRAREMEIAKASKDSAEKNYGAMYEFANEKVDRPLLNSRTIGDEDVLD